MLNYEVYADKSAVLISSVGKTTVDDYQTKAPQFFADMKSQNIRRVLIDHTQFEGWESKTAESLAFYAWTQLRSFVKEIGLLVRNRSGNDESRFLEFFENAEIPVRVFESTQRQAALNWLKQKNDIV